MGRPINNLRKANLRIKINKAGYKTLVGLANRVFLFMTGNLQFPTPSPSLASLQTAATGLKNAASQMGQKRSRGSKADLQQAQLNAITLRDILTAELQYVINTATQANGENIPAFAAMIASSGFALKDVRSLTPRLQQSTFVRQTNNKIFNGATNGSVRINWKRPLGLIKGKPIAGYNIIIGGEIVQTVTKTNAFITVAPGTTKEVTIQPFNRVGTGQTFYTQAKAIYN